MKREGIRLFNSQSARVNIILLVSIVLIFVLTVLTAEAMEVTLRSPGNFTFYSNASMGRNLNFSFSSNWSFSGAAPALHENVSNCSLHINSTAIVSPWGVAVKNVSRDDIGADNNLSNGSAALSYMNFTFTEDGNYTYAIACRNFSNASAAHGLMFSQNFTVFIDGSAPSVNYTDPGAGNGTSALNFSATGNRKIQFKINDSGYGLNISLNRSINISIFLGGSIVEKLTYINTSSATNISCNTVASAEASTATVTCNSSYTLLSNGTYILNATARDALGLVSTDNLVRITIDQIPPNISRLNATNSSNPYETPAQHLNFSQGSKIYIVANVTDNLTQPSIGRLQFFNTSSSSWQNLTNVSDGSVATSGALKVNFSGRFYVNATFVPPVARNEFEGRNVSFRIVVNDTLGNSNDSNSLENVTLVVNDLTTPDITINGSISVNGTNTPLTSILVGWAVAESNSLAEVNISVDGIETDDGCDKFKRFTTTVNQNRNFSFNTSSAPGCTFTNGTHFITVRARDTWGNSKVNNHTFTVQAGQVPALIFSNVTMPNSAGTGISRVNNTNITSTHGLNFTGLSGEVSIDNLTYVSSCNTSNTVRFLNASVIFPFNESSCPTTAANRTLTVTITDTAGNSNTTTFGFLVDNVGPQLTVTKPTDGANELNNLSVNISAIDDVRLSSFGYFLDGSNILTLLNHTEGTLSTAGVNITFFNKTTQISGTHTIKFRANDTFGNERNSSVFTSTVVTSINFLSVNGSFESNSSANFNTNITNVTISVLTDSGYQVVTTINDTNLTLQISFVVNDTDTGVVNSSSTRGAMNVTLADLNGTAANWDRMTFFPMIHNLTAARNNETFSVPGIENNWTNKVLKAMYFNNSIQEFISNNNSYYGIVVVPFNITINDLTGNSTAQEFWWFPDSANLKSRTNITKCTGGFSATTTAPCWNYTTAGRTIIQVPHFSGVAVVNDSSGPTITINTPTTVGNHTVSMFEPNITVSSDTATCSYSVNTTQGTVNKTMTKTGLECIGETERFKNNVTGVYNLTFYAIDTTGNIGNLSLTLNMSDTTVPGKETITSSGSSTSGTITVSGINESVNVTVNYGGTNTSLASSSTSGSTDFSTSQQTTISGLTASTTYYYNVTICDFNGNCKDNGTFSFATSAAAAAAAAAAAGGGGGGGGGTPSNEAASAARRWDALAVGSSAALTVNSPDIAVTGVTFDVKIDLANAEVKVASLLANPLTTPAAAKVYQYLQMTTTNIAAGIDTGTVTITFKVPKSWLATNGVAEGDVVLYRYVGGNWVALPTSQTGADTNNVLYQATTPAFSTFAIGSKEAAPVVAPPPVEQPIEQPPAPVEEQPPAPVEEAPEAMEKKPLSRTAMAWIVVGIIVIVAGIGYFMWQRKKEEF